VTGIRRLFLPHVGRRDSAKQLFEEFQNSLWDRLENCQDVPRERRTSQNSLLNELPPEALKRREFLKPELQREVLCELLSETSCAEWLGFNDLARPDTRPPLRSLAGLIREPGWTDAKNVHKLRTYRAAAFIDCLRPNVLDWETPCIPDMEWVLEFIEVFTRPGISVEQQTALLDDLSRHSVPLEKIVQAERAPRRQLSLDDLRYVWETRELSHEERAATWDKRTPKPFQPFGRSNLEMYRDKKVAQNWRVGVKNQVKNAKKLFDSDPSQDEGEAN
jgi:hypothetical protein